MRSQRLVHRIMEEIAILAVETLREQLGVATNGEPANGPAR